MKTIHQPRLLSSFMMLYSVLLVSAAVAQNKSESFERQEANFKPAAFGTTGDEMLYHEMNDGVPSEVNRSTSRKLIPFGFPVNPENKAGEEGPRIMAGVNILTVPFKTKYIFVEGEVKLANKLSATVRVSYARLHRETGGRSYGTKTEDSKGAGFGASVRYYFTGDGQLKGFFTGLGVELMVGKWNNYHSDEVDPIDYGTYTAPAPHVDLGYKFLLGKEKRFYLDPMIALGFYSSASHNDRTGEDTNEIGFFGFPGLTFGVKLF